MDMSKIVTFTNITDEDFSHPYNGQAYFVAKREVRMFPFELADHLATHLARKILLSQDKPVSVRDDVTGGVGAPIWSEEAVLQLKAKILGEVETQVVAAPKTDDEILRDKVQELNQVTDTPETPQTLMTKVDVIKALKAQGKPVDVRKTKSELLAQLNS